MSNGRRCLIRDLGLVKGGKGLRHHEVVLELSLLGLVRYALTTIRNGQTEQPVANQQEAAPSIPYRDGALET